MPWCSGYTWREGRHGVHDLDRGRVDVVDDAKRLLMVRVLRDCHVVVCVSRLPLPDCVSVVVAAAVVFLLPLLDCVLVALGGRDVLTMLLIEDVLTLLMLIMDC